MATVWKKFFILVYILLIGVLIAATFIERSYGTPFVTDHIYHTVWFCCLWGILACFVAITIIKFKWWKRLPVLLLHSSFLIILGGAILTYLTGEKGFIHLREGNEQQTFTRESDKKLLPLPFTLRLDSFRIAYYPGTEAPSDYISRVTYTVEDERNSENISMNHILTIKGYRLYQSSFDDDHKGSWLSVNYDPWGIGVTYTGYALLALSSLGLLLGRKESFFKLLKNPLLRKGGLLLALLFAFQPPVLAKLKYLKLDDAEKTKTRQVIYQDRIAPFNTLARDFTLKLTGKPSYRGLTPEQVVCSWVLFPESWQYEPMIQIKNAELRKLLGCKSKNIALIDLFDGKTYKLEKLLSKGSQGAESTGPLNKAILDLDEKVGLILMLQQGTLIKPLPEDGSVPALSETRVKAELLYNRIPFTKVLFMCNLSLGLLSFGGFLYISLRKTQNRAKWITYATNGFVGLLFLSCLFHWAGYLLRWYIGGRIPLSNGYETMLFMAGCMLILSCWLQKRFLFIVPFGFLLSGFALLVSYLGQMNPQITPLMPVLLSPWLSIHVSLIMVSYALYAYMFLNGILAICLHKHKERVKQLMLFSQLMSYPATLFLGIGIFIGSVWANVSWGSYWSWDSKEVWALITFMIYAVAFHSTSLPWLRKPANYHLYMVVSFLSVLMTYIGVNYFLSGMHSYA